MKLHRAILFSVVTAGYFAVFLTVDTIHQNTEPQLPSPLPAPIYELGGPFKELLGDLLLIQTKVFLGGKAAGTDPLSYAENLDRHLATVSVLHPRLLDTYFLCESSLPWISKHYAEQSNQILIAGSAARPELWTIPFFTGFNYFRFLQDNSAAVYFLEIAAGRPSGPQWVSDLARILTMDGGEIVASFLFLREMRRQTRDPELRARLDIGMNEHQKAMRVLRAIASFKKIRGHKPDKLTELMPQFIAKLPKMENGYSLTYAHGQLHLLLNSSNQP